MSKLELEIEIERMRTDILYFASIVFPKLELRDREKTMLTAAKGRTMFFTGRAAGTTAVNKIHYRHYMLFNRGLRSPTIEEFMKEMEQIKQGE